PTVEKLRRAIAARRAITVTVRNYRKDGRTFWNELSVNPVFDERGQLIHFVGILTDVTARMRAEAALRRSERDLRVLASTHAATLDALPAFVALLDPDGTVVSINRAWREQARAHGVPVEVGRSYPQQLESASSFWLTEAPGIADGVRAVLAGEVPVFAREYAHRGPQGRRWHKFVATPVIGEDSRGAVVMHLDITDRIDAEEAL